MLNKFIGIGNLTKDPQLKELNEGKAVCVISVAINMGKDDKNPFYVDVQYWDNLARNCAKYLKKGRQVFVEGKMSINSWEDKNGNKRQKFYCKGEVVRFLSSETKQDSKKESSKEKPQEHKNQNINKDLEEELSEIPF